MSGPAAVPLNCPYCGRLTAHLHSERDWHFYQCEPCGPITLPPSGLIHRTYPATKPDDRKHGT